MATIAVVVIVVKMLSIISTAAISSTRITNPRILAGGDMPARAPAAHLPSPSPGPGAELRTQGVGNLEFEV